MLSKLHSSHSPHLHFCSKLLFHKDVKIYRRFDECACLYFYLTGKCPFLLPPASSSKCHLCQALNQRNRDLLFLMCQSDYVLSFFVIIHLCIFSCQQTESYFRDWIMSHSACLHNGWENTSQNKWPNEKVNANLG